jgi:hypothetical protein
MFSMRDLGLSASKVELSAIVKQFDGKKSVGGGLMEGISSILEVTCD